MKTMEAESCTRYYNQLQISVKNKLKITKQWKLGNVKFSSELIKLGRACKYNSWLHKAVQRIGRRQKRKSKEDGSRKKEKSISKQGWKQRRRFPIFPFQCCVTELFLVFLVKDSELSYYQH